MADPLFNEIYAVGDSLSDSGGVYGLSRQALLLAAAAGVDTQGLQPIPISPPYAGKFSNGPVLPEISADLLGADLHNFAFGGARALGTQTLAEAAGTAIPGTVLAAIDALPANVKAPIETILDHNINLPGQVTDFVAVTSAHAPADDSALVSMIGLNDLRGLAASFDPNDPLALLSVLQLAGGIVQANIALAHTAFDHGIDTVIFETLPAATFFPITSQQLAPALQTIADAAVDAVNAGLQSGAAALQQQGLDVRIVDLARMADEISADPATFGFVNLQQPTLLGNGIQFTVNPSAPSIEQTAFFDPVHATTNLHGLLAAFAAASLTSHTDFRGDGNDLINGTSGNDLVLAGVGNDQAFLGDGSDILLGGLGTDFIDGGAGSDLIAGGAGNDQLWGSVGADVLSGNAGDDTLHGGPGDDALIDGPGNDTLYGDAGDDQFFDATVGLASLAARNDTPSLAELADLFRAFGGNDVDRAGAGNDFVDGGDGVDTAHYSGPSSHYKLVASPTTATVLDRVGTDGFDTLVSIELAQFADRTLDTTWLTKAASVPASQLTDLTDMYIAYFDRAPDAIGLFYWASRLGDGMTLQQISRSFFVQPETVAAYPASQTTVEFVTKVYDNVLGRAPDQPGLNYWVNQLQTRGVSKDEFMLAIIYGARAVTGSPADAQYLANKDAVGKDFAVAEGLSNAAWAKTVMADVDGTAASVQAAFHVIDGFAASAALPNSPELVVQLIGVAV